MRAVIFSNGEFKPTLKARQQLRAQDILIAANGGTHHCLTLGISPHYIIGDTDSLTIKERQDCHAAGTQFLQYPPNKDQTDLELALNYAVQLNVNEILLMGLLGHRWDMTFANIFLLMQPVFSKVSLQIWNETHQIFVIRGGQTKTLQAKPGTLVSVLPIGEDAIGLTYQGLTYPLENATLSFGSPQGVSNIMQNAKAQISLKKGTVLCFLQNQNAV